MVERGGAAQLVVLEKTPLLIKTLVSHPAAFFIESVAQDAGGLQVEGALVVKLGAQLDAVRAALDDLAKQFPAPFVKSVKVNGVECTQLKLDEKAPAITVCYQDDYLIAAAGDKSLAGVLSRAATDPPQWLTDAMGEFHIARPSTFAYMDTAATLKLVAMFGGPQAGKTMDLLGLSSVTSAISMTGLDETGFVSRTKVRTTDPDKGLGKLISRQPLTAKDLAGIPHDATIAVAFRFDVGQALDQGLKLLDEIEPRRRMVSGRACDNWIRLWGSASRMIYSVRWGMSGHCIRHPAAVAGWPGGR